MDPYLTTAAVAGGAGLLGALLSRGITSGEGKNIASAWVGAVDDWKKEDEESTQLPDFRRRARHYQLWGARASQLRPLGLKMENVQSIAQEIMPGYFSPDVRDHYKDFSKGPVSAYMQELRERENWRHRTDDPKNTFFEGRGDAFYQSKKPRWSRAKTVTWDKNVHPKVMKDIHAHGMKYPSVAKYLKRNQLTTPEELDRFGKENRLFGVSSERDSLYPMQADIRMHANSLAQRMNLGADLDELSPKEQEYVYEALDDYIAKEDPQLWLKKQYADAEIGYGLTPALSYYGSAIVKPALGIKSLGNTVALAGGGISALALLGYLVAGRK